MTVEADPEIINFAAEQGLIQWETWRAVTYVGILL